MWRPVVIMGRPFPRSVASALASVGAATLPPIGCKCACFGRGGDPCSDRLQVRLLRSGRRPSLRSVASALASVGAALPPIGCKCACSVGAPAVWGLMQCPTDWLLGCRDRPKDRNFSTAGRVSCPGPHRGALGLLSGGPPSFQRAFFSAVQHVADGAVVRGPAKPRGFSSAMTPSHPPCPAGLRLVAGSRLERWIKTSPERPFFHCVVHRSRFPRTAGWR